VAAGVSAYLWYDYYKDKKAYDKAYDEWERNYSIWWDPGTNRVVLTFRF
jgi:hypothetical protein